MAAGVCVSWMFVLQVLFIAQGQEGNGRRGGKACGKKTKTVAGHELRASSLAFQPEGGDARAVSIAHRHALMTPLVVHTRAFFQRLHPSPWRAQLKSTFRSGRQVCCAAGLWGTATHASGMKHSPQQVPIWWRGSWYHHCVFGGFG